MGDQKTMVELNTVLIVGLIGFGVGALTVGVFILLVAIHKNIKTVNDQLRTDDGNDPGTFAIPLSALGGLGPNRGITSDDIRRAAAAVAAQNSASIEKKPDLGGQYL